MNDIFFSPSGKSCIAIGAFSYNLLLKKDSNYWEYVTNNFIFPDADMKSGLFINENFALAVDAWGYIHSIINRDNDIAWGRKKFWAKALNDIDFYKDSPGIVVGSEGCVLRAINFNGEEFDTLAKFTTNDLYALDVVNESTVFIAGNNTVWKSTDFYVDSKTIEQLVKSEILKEYRIDIPPR